MRDERERKPVRFVGSSQSDLKKFPKEVKVVVGNIFRDLGLPEAEVLQAKADLVQKIATLIEKRGLTQVEAAAILGVTQPKISALLHGRIDGFSMERIVKYLAALDQDVRISVRPKAHGASKIKIARAATR